MITPKQAELILIRCIVLAIAHVNELKLRRVKISSAEATGMFVTALRREFMSSPLAIPLFNKFYQTITDKKLWYAVGKPKIEDYLYPWTFDIVLEGGVWSMSNSYVEHVCLTASIQAGYNHDAAIAINHSLKELESGLKNMQARVTIAAGINSEAEQVLASLCQVAEKLIA